MSEPTPEAVPESEPFLVPTFPDTDFYLVSTDGLLSDGIFDPKELQYEPDHKFWFFYAASGRPWLIRILEQNGNVIRMLDGNPPIGEIEWEIVPAEEMARRFPW